MSPKTTQILNSADSDLLESPTTDGFSIDYVDGVPVLSFGTNFLSHPTIDARAIERLDMFAQDTCGVEVLADLSSAAYLSSAALGVLASFASNLRASGSRLVASGPSSIVAAALRAASLVEFIELPSKSTGPKAAQPVSSCVSSQNAATVIVVLDNDAEPLSLETLPVSRTSDEFQFHFRHVSDMPGTARLDRSQSPAVFIVALSRSPDWLTVRATTRRCAQSAPTIVCTSCGSVSRHDVSQLIAAGARRVLNRDSIDFDVQLTEQILDLSREEFGLRQEDQHLRKKFARFNFVGSSFSILDVLRQAAQVAEIPDVPLLITGESGTGKTLLAKAIHQLDSVHQNGVLHPVNCASINGPLAESELFGHVQGAFSGANSERRGAFQTADGGVLLLDEIGDLDPLLQPKLLHAIQEKCFFPVGTDTALSVRLRIIAATNRPLRDQIANGTFREDLYHRLTTFHIHIPPLRERPDDAEVLLVHFLNRYNVSTDTFSGIDDYVTDAIRTYSWKGNAREVENLARAILANGARGPTLRYDDLPSDFHRRLVACESREHSTDSEQFSSPPDVLESLLGSLGSESTLEDAVAAFERMWLLRTLDDWNWNRTRAARALNIDRSTLTRKIARFGLRQPVKEPMQ